MFTLSDTPLLPHTTLPLSIFEPCYLAMIEEAVGEGRVFGLIQPDPSHVDLPNGLALFTIGCPGRMPAFSETDNNPYLITLSGLYPSA